MNRALNNKLNYKEVLIFSLGKITDFYGILKENQILKNETISLEYTIKKYKTIIFSMNIFFILIMSSIILGIYFSSQSYSENIVFLIISPALILINASSFILFKYGRKS